MRRARDTRDVVNGRERSLEKRGDLGEDANVERAVVREVNLLATEARSELRVGRDERPERVEVTRSSSLEERHPGAADLSREGVERVRLRCRCRRRLGGRGGRSVTAGRNGADDCEDDDEAGQWWLSSVRHGGACRRAGPATMWPASRTTVRRPERSHRVGVVLGAADVRAGDVVHGAAVLLRGPVVGRMDPSNNLPQLSRHSVRRKLDRSRLVFCCIPSTDVATPPVFSALPGPTSTPRC